MNGKKREEEKHEGKKAGREGGEKIKMKGQREECHLVISGVRKLWKERKAHVEYNGKRLTPQVGTQHQRHLKPLPKTSPLQLLPISTRILLRVNFTGSKGLQALHNALAPSASNRPVR